MPVVAVKRDELFRQLGRTYSEEEFGELCFDFGLELDEVTSERAMMKAEQGVDTSKASDDVIFKIEVPANRYDLLCVEGLVRMLQIFLGLGEPPQYTLKVPSAPQKILVKSSVLGVRPVVVGAILRGITFTPANYASFIEIQEKLHQNICRKRTLVSVGTHDLDTIKGPFIYEARKPENISFVPLNDTKLLNGRELMQELAEGHLKPYLHIIRDKPLYPVISDSNGVVLSLPPIINSEHSKIKLSTKNVFIEITATDLTKAKVVLNTIVCMFSEYAAEKFSVEAVETVDAEGKTVRYPDLSYREEPVSVEEINGLLGLRLTAEDVCGLLKKMSLVAKPTTNGKDVVVLVPPTRSDIIHPRDLMEDVGIAYGYNNLKLTVPPTYTVAKQQPVNKYTDLLRHELAFAGYTEIFTLSLCARDENFQMLRRPEDGTAVILANPASQEFQIGRTTLLVGSLKTIQASRDQPLPLRIFEVSDVMLQDKTTDTGARNSRRLCALYSNKTSGFELIHGLLDRVMLVLGVRPHKTEGYSIRPSEDPAFFPGRRVDVLLKGEKVGVFGIIHPEVLGNFGIVYPVSALEVDIEPFLALRVPQSEKIKNHEKEKEKETETKH